MRIPKLKLPLAIAFVLLGFCVVGTAQQTDTFRVKKSPPEKAPRKIVPISKAAGSTTASSANAKDLQTLERQTAHTAKPAGSASKRAAGPALKPVKDKPNPPINFSGTSAKSPGLTNQSSNPYRGRLRQKHSHQ
ncbi:MAG: hypothetical protein WBE52_13245 [Terriglobales bacterium]